MLTHKNNFVCTTDKQEINRRYFMIKNIKLWPAIVTKHKRVSHE